MIAIGMVFVWVVGMGVRNGMRPEECGYLFSEQNWKNGPGPLANIFWPIEAVGRLPLRLGDFLGERIQGRSSGLPRARLIERNERDVP